MSRTEAMHTAHTHSGWGLADTSTPLLTGRQRRAHSASKQRRHKKADNVHLSRPCDGINTFRYATRQQQGPHAVRASGLGVQGRQRDVETDRSRVAGVHGRQGSCKAKRHVARRAPMPRRAARINIAHVQLVDSAASRCGPSTGVHAPCDSLGNPGGRSGACSEPRFASCSVSKRLCRRHRALPCEQFSAPRPSASDCIMHRKVVMQCEGEVVADRNRRRVQRAPRRGGYGVSGGAWGRRGRGGEQPARLQVVFLCDGCWWS